MAKLLLCEDESALVETLSRQLKSSGFIVDVAEDGAQALYLAKEFDYDLWILDLGLPKIDGLSVLKQLRQEGFNTRVLILTARNNWQDRVAGLKAGADDYLGKPFHFEELLARIEALLKRPHQSMSSNLQYDRFELKIADKYLVSHENGKQESWSLTKTEFTLLLTFFQHPGQVYSKDQLLQKLGDQHYEREGNLIEVYIRKLRGYLGKEAIETLRGQGYRLVAK